MPLNKVIRPKDEEGGRIEKGTHRVPLQMQARSLGSFIGWVKAAVTGRARRELNAAKIWQRDYHEHVVRSENELKTSGIILTPIWTVGRKTNYTHLHQVVICCNDLPTGCFPFRFTSGIP